MIETINAVHRRTESHPRTSHRIVVIYGLVFVPAEIGKLYTQPSELIDQCRRCDGRRQEPNSGAAICTVFFDRGPKDHREVLPRFRSSAKLDLLRAVRV